MDQYRTPTDSQQVYTVTRYELLKHFRSKRLLGIIVIELIILALFLAVPPLAGHDYKSDPAAFAEDYFSWAWILVVIGATLFAGDALTSEFQNRTGYLIFPNPVKRNVYFTGKLLASIIIMFVVLLIYYALTSVFALVITGGVSSLTLNSLSLALLFAVAAISVGYLVSAIMKGSTGALVLTFALLFLIFPIITGVFTAVQVKPSFSLTFAAGAVQYIMQTPYPTDFVQTIDVGGNTFEINNYYPDPNLAPLIMLVYIVVALVLAIILFNRREMVG